MAGDKLRDGFPIAVQFGAGEQPADAKLNGWANQTQNALNALEKAVGDVFDQSQALGGTNKLSNRDLQIANIGRLIGPASMLSPQILHDVRITDFLVSIPVGVKEFVLPHPPLVSGGASVIDWNASARFTDEKLAADALVDAGDFYVDYNTGRVFTYSITQAGDTAEYDYDSIGDSFDNATLNVIPDPNQVTEKCTITVTTGGFFVDLPFIKYDQDGALATDGSDPNYSDTASIHNTLRAQLPSFLTVLTVGDIIPDGFMYIFDQNIGQIVAGAIFRYESQTRVKVESVNLEVGSSRYSIMTIGAPLSEILFAVRKLQRTHIHDGSDGGQRLVHASLTGNLYESALVDMWGAADAQFQELGYVPSVLAGNQHPQYLMRSGYAAGKDPNNSNNAMRGDLLMGSVSPVGNDYANISGDSRSVFFGAETGPRLRYNNVYDALQLAAKDLMTDGNVTVGRSSAVDSNTSYLGFGSDPVNNHIVLNEGHAAGLRYQFIGDGLTTGVDVEAGDFIAVGSSPPRYYFGDKTGVNDTYWEGNGNNFDAIRSGLLANSGLRGGSLTTAGGTLYFNTAGDDYLNYVDGSNRFDFVADNSIAAAWIRCGNLTLDSGNSIIEMPNSSNRLYKSSSQFVFDHAGSWVNSILLCGAVNFAGWTMGVSAVSQLIGGDTQTDIHNHNYARAQAWENSEYFNDVTAYRVRSFSSGVSSSLLTAGSRGFWSDGNHGDNDWYVSRINSSQVAIYLFSNTGPDQVRIYYNVIGRFREQTADNI